MNNENKEINTKKPSVFKKPWMQSLISVIVIFGALAGVLYWQSSSNTVFIENSYLTAPEIDIAPTAPGVLNAVYVKEGDSVTIDQQIAVVGSETLYAKEDGVVSVAPTVVGSYFNTGQTIVSVVADKKMQVVGSIDETGGLNRIASGQVATFSVDAFPGKTYKGVVDKVGATSNVTGVIFSISDKRPTEKFNVYVNFDVSKYPELKSGMSAKITVFTRT